MSTKNKIQILLEKNKDQYISGQEIAKEIGVSRAAIWKAIQSLKEEGYFIESVTNKGYKLLPSNDILSEEGIRINLIEKYAGRKIIVLNSVDSTNAYAKKLGIDSAEHGTIVVADEQTKGRGRFGRTFFSKQGKGIYLSVILRPQIEISGIAFSTVVSAVAVLRALKRFTDEEIRIKWVNDLYVRDKKVCGILTELVSDMETGSVDFIVAGIGININASEEDFSEEIRGIAGSLKPDKTSRNEIIAAICNELFDIFEDLDKEEIMAQYKMHQLALGKTVRFHKDGKWYEGLAQDIDDSGALIVECSGEKLLLQSGEISIKIKE